MLAMLRQAAALAIACALFPGIGERIAYRRGIANQLRDSACKSGYEEVYEEDEEEIGTGGHATAHEVTDRTNGQEFCAKRFIHKDQFDILEAVPAVLRLPFTSAVREVYPNEAIFVMPLYGGGELYKHVFNTNDPARWEDKAPEFCERATTEQATEQTKQKKMWLAQSAYGLYQLHKHGIIHADFKLENAVMHGYNNEGMSVIDYGASQLGCPVDGTACCGTRKVATTPGIFPPYTCNAKYSFEVDFFSWAIAALELLMEYPLIDRGRLERGVKTDCQVNDQEAKRVLKSVSQMENTCEKLIKEDNLLQLIIRVLESFKEFENLPANRVSDSMFEKYRAPKGPGDHPVLEQFKNFGIVLSPESGGDADQCPEFGDDAARFWHALCLKFAEGVSKRQCCHDSKSSPVGLDNDTDGLYKEVDGLCENPPGKKIKMRLVERLSPRKKNQAAIEEDCFRLVSETGRTIMERKPDPQ